MWQIGFPLLLTLRVILCSCRQVALSERLYAALALHLLPNRQLHYPLSSYTEFMFIPVLRAFSEGEAHAAQVLRHRLIFPAEPKLRLVRLSTRINICPRPPLHSGSNLSCSAAVGVLCYRYFWPKLRIRIQGDLIEIRGGFNIAY